MGKKIKKTRWRTLTLNGHQSDSEESCSKSNNYQRKYSKFFYSSHSSPVRKFHNDDSNKTTRSNSTTSEQKTTFNEDEYTRITTPRQDVLFKKGYLNKPKSYQKQTSTGTCSTANSTSTCTPDHQSADGTEGTDLEYESQLVFPNGFIDHNGIYYINSFEPFPFVVYNAPICYQDYPRAKRYSTDSLTGSISPHNEESGITNASAQPSDEPSVDDEPRRQKKRRRRKISRSKSITSQDSTDSGEVFKTEDETTKSTTDAQNLLLQSLTKTYSLKPDAEEFVPRNLRAPEAFAFDPNVQFVNIQPNFIPVPFINSIGDLHQRTPLLPLNFISPDSKLYPTYINVIPNSEYADEAAIEETTQVEVEEKDLKKKSDIDIAKIVSKLEETAKQQKFNDNKRQGYKTRGNFSRQQRFSRYRNEKPKISEVDEKVTDQPCWGPKPKPVDVVSRIRDDCSNAQNVVRRARTNATPQEKRVEVVKAVASPVRTPRKTNQWISVSSRKKRKNKDATDGEGVAQEDEEEAVQNDDLFESFDVSLLVDVVPSSEPVLADEPPLEPEPTVEIPEPTPEQEPEPTTTELAPTPTPAVVTETQQVKDDQLKKKKKKTAQKVPIKRVMVIDLPMPVPPPQETKAAEPRPVVAPAEVPEKVEAKTVEKKKKKKKKATPLQKVQSVSSSNTTLNGDDSYDFLIENSILEEFEEKTNVEMSQELDRMIQKGMYSHLEEKIRALNLCTDDEFFKAVVKTEKSPDDDESQASTSSNLGLLTWNSQEFQDKGEDYQNTSIDLTTSNIFSVPTEPILKTSPSQYPITRAVKEWMTKTRENTPDVEILKSPNTIYKEFYESDGDSKSEDDVTVWTVSSDVNGTPADVAVGDGLDCDMKLNGHIEDCEEAVEVYESKYGKNEDFLKIKGEVDAHYKNRNFPPPTPPPPRHGDLPYRAICCNLM